MTVPSAVVEMSSSASTQKADNSSHRLPTQSAAAAALQVLHGTRSSTLSSGLSSLDLALTGGSPSSRAGLQRGKLTEIWGPSGAGKTALAFQTATQALRRGEAVVWLDTTTLLSASRLKELQSVGSRQLVGTEDDACSAFFYHSVPTLSHLLAFVVHPPSFLIPENLALLVVDDLNALIDLDYPRLPYSSGNRNELQKWQAGRRYAILGSLVTALSQLACVHDMVVLMTTGCSSRMRSDSGLAAGIGPGVGGSEWEGGVWSRVVVFRDFNGRFVGVQKCLGRNMTPLDPVGDVKNIIRFETIGNGALKEHIIDLASSALIATTLPSKKINPSPLKLICKRPYDEVADSDEDGDEYGWAEDDEIIAADAATKQPQLSEIPKVPAE